MVKLRKNSAAHQLLKKVALVSGVFIISTINPIAGTQIVRMALAGYFRRKSFERSRLLRDLKSLQTRNLIEYQELPNKNIRLILTKTGKKKILSFDLDNMILKMRGHWDGKWRVITFDIPNEKRAARDAFRQKLKNLKFHQLHKSVFITPYPCEDEIDFLSSFYEVGKNVLLLTVSHFEGEEKLKHHFGL